MLGDPPYPTLDCMSYMDWMDQTHRPKGRDAFYGRTGRIRYAPSARGAYRAAPPRAGVCGFSTRGLFLSFQYTPADSFCHFSTHTVTS